jgi:hypothetical protein
MTSYTPPRGDIYRHENDQHQPMTIVHGPSRSAPQQSPLANTAASLAFAVQQDVNNAIAAHRNSIPVEKLNDYGRQEALASFGQSSAPEHLAASKDVTHKALEAERAGRGRIRAALSEVGREHQSDADVEIRRLERQLPGLDQGKRTELCRAAIQNAPMTTKGAVADELHSILRANGVEDTSWIEGELARAVPELAEAEARVQKRQQVVSIVDYNAKVIEQGMLTGQPVKFLVDPSKYDPDQP